jgi:phosphoglycolate phosphatase-like HAD superfamily hydrolase
MRGKALIFDLDGTLVDTVYAHVFAWQKALDEAGLRIDGWRVHRRIGMSGGLFTRAIAREIGHELDPQQVRDLQARHGDLYRSLLPRPRPFPGAVELLRRLRELGVAFGIATSGRRPEIDASLDALEIPSDTVVIERGDVARAKPRRDAERRPAERGLRRRGTDPRRRLPRLPRRQRAQRVARRAGGTAVRQH